MILPLEEAAGKILAHDITEIRPGQFKGAAFKKGQRIREEDLDHLRRLGKEHLYVLSLGPGEFHEDEAALELAAAFAGEGVVFDPHPSEGKISLRAGITGLLKVEVEALTEVNMVQDISCASRHTDTLVREGEIVAATRAIPLVIRQEMLSQAVRAAREAGGLFRVKALQRPRTGLVVTGNEVYHHLIEDKFAPLIRSKLASFGCELLAPVFAPDYADRIASAIEKVRAREARLILVAGGMSVDPDDVTRTGIARAGARDLVYGTPVLPGAMFLYARLGNVPVLGLPACVLYYRATVLDLLLPRVLAGEGITRRDLARMAHGGLCLNCIECRYPVCPFGK